MSEDRVEYVVNQARGGQEEPAWCKYRDAMTYVWKEWPIKETLIRRWVDRGYEIICMKRVDKV